MKIIKESAYEFVFKLAFKPQKDFNTLESYINDKSNDFEKDIGDIRYFISKNRVS